MPVGIAEIDAVAAARPIGAAFDGDALLAQSLLPLRQLIRSNGKGLVQRPMAVVRGYRAARHAHGFERGAAAKQQQNAPAADVIGASSNPSQVANDSGVFDEPHSRSGFELDARIAA